jgi:hypothetical protein
MHFADTTRDQNCDICTAFVDWLRIWVTSYTQGSPPVKIHMKNQYVTMMCLVLASSVDAWNITH